MPAWGADLLFKVERSLAEGRLLSERRQTANE